MKSVCQRDYWNLIVLKRVFGENRYILEGQLKYMITEPKEEVVILSDVLSGVVEPTIFHEAEPLGRVRFYVEFYRKELN